MVGSCSDHGRKRPSIVIRVLRLFLEVQISWQAQHFVNLHVQITWQAQHFVNLHVQISWQAQHFVNLHVQIAWQAQYFVNLHVQISWQAQHFVNLHASPNLDGEAPRNDGVRRSRVMSDHASDQAESSLHCD